jgi:hypothetical protein
VTRAQIEEIRGAALSQATLDALLEAALVEPRGRLETPGRPTTWGTTAQFLAQISRLETRGLAPKRRLDPALILRAIAAGTTVESIIARLTELSLTPVSAAVTSTIADIANNGRFITLNGTGTDTAAKASHPELGEMLLTDPRLQRLAPVKVDDLSVLYGASRLRVETALVENRYTVVAPATEPVIAEPNAPTALSARRPSRNSTRSSRPTATRWPVRSPARSRGMSSLPRPAIIHQRARPRSSPTMSRQPSTTA